MNKKRDLSIRELLSESLIRELVLFLFLFILCVSQYWDNIFLFIFPMISFGFYLFFKIVSINKWRIQFYEELILYHPLGWEKRHANRFYFISLFNLLLILWIGAESLYHPQLIEEYSFYFIILLVFMHSFGFFWIFIDFWKYSRISIQFQKNQGKMIFEDLKKLKINAEKLIGYLKLKNLKLISIANFIVFLVINILNILLVLIMDGMIPIIGFTLSFPGTGNSSYEGLKLSYLIYVILIAPPVSCFISFFLSYKDVINLEKENIDKFISILPKNLQINIKQNLISINSKFKHDLRIE